MSFKYSTILYQEDFITFFCPFVSISSIPHPHYLPTQKSTPTVYSIYYGSFYPDKSSKRSISQQARQDQNRYLQNIARWKIFSLLHFLQAEPSTLLYSIIICWGLWQYFMLRVFNTLYQYLVLCPIARYRYCWGLMLMLKDKILISN